MKKILQSIYSTNAVFELRNTKIIVSLLTSLCLGSLTFIPFTFLFFELGTYRFDQTNWELTEIEQDEIIQNLPNDCYFADAIFICDSDLVINLRSDLTIHFSDESVNLINGIVFTDSELQFFVNETVYHLSYQVFDNLRFDELISSTYGFDLLFNLIASEIRPQLLPTFVLGAYQTGIISYLIFVLVVTLLSMLLKFGHTHFISFKQMFNLIVFSSMQIVVLLLVVGLAFTPAFTTLIFNFGTPIRAYAVYKKEVIPYLMRQS